MYQYNSHAQYVDLEMRSGQFAQSILDFTHGICRHLGQLNIHIEATLGSFNARTAASQRFSSPSFTKHWAQQAQCLVGEEGLEPSHLAALAPKASVSTNSTTRPWLVEAA